MKRERKKAKVDVCIKRVDIEEKAHGMSAPWTNIISVLSISKSHFKLNSKMN